MTEHNHKIRCNVCQWHGRPKERLSAPSPFDTDDTLYGCPECKTADTFVFLCDVGGCQKEATCGWPDGKGEYWSTCGEHMRSNQEQ